MSISMDDPTNVDALVERFGELTPDIVAEFLSMLRIYAIDDQELFFKWESYCIKMGSEDTKLNFDTVCAFKKDVQEQLEKTSKARSRQYINNVPRAVQKTPRHMKGDGLVLLVSPGNLA
jgi:DNA polymerase alpha subunit B